MPEITITTPEVQKLLSKINPQKAHGSGNIPACVLKEIASALAPMLSGPKQSVSLDSRDFKNFADFVEDLIN